MKKALLYIILLAVLLGAPAAMAQGLTVCRLPYSTQLQPQDGVYTLKQSGSYAVYGTAEGERIEVCADATLILSGVEIDLSASQDGAAPLSVEAGSTVELILANHTENTLHAAVGAAGVEAEAGSTLIIRCQSGAGHICTERCGSLEAQGGHAAQEESAAAAFARGTFAFPGVPGGSTSGSAAGAGIGGGAGRSSGSITIESGRINASGGESSTISGGAPGIGGGGNTEQKEGKAHSGSIVILGGEVQAQGAVGAAGIGGGDWGGEGRGIRISGGTVTARGGDGAAGIGGGFRGAGRNIHISGGEVSAFGGEEASGIGGGYAKPGQELKVSGGHVRATAGAQYVYPRKPSSGSISPVNDAIGSGAEAKTAQITVAPSGMAIAVRAGENAQDAQLLSGSPFVSARGIISEVDDAGFVEMWEEPMPASVPATGDGFPLQLWLALAVLSAAGMLLLGKKAVKP